VREYVQDRIRKAMQYCFCGAMDPCECLSMCFVAHFWKGQARQRGWPRGCVVWNKSICMCACVFHSLARLLAFT
jgi:hypothetical protein